MTNEIQLVTQWPEIEKAIQLFIDSRRNENTKAAYRADWQKWLTFVLSTGTDLAMPGLAATTAFRDQLVEVYASKSIYRILGSLSFFYAALRDAGVVRTNPFVRAWLPRPEVSDVNKTQVVDDSAVERLEASIARDFSPAGRRDAAIVRVFYDTGLRRSSLVTLKRDQLRMDGAVLTALVFVKGGKEAPVTFTLDAANAMAAWITVAPKSPYVFPGRNPVKHLSLQAINHILKTRAEACGLTGHDVHPHRFRAAFVTTAYDAKLLESDIQSAVHHAHAHTTRGYDRKARGADVYDKVAEFRKDKKKP